MNVLMITEKDAANVSLSKIADKFLENGDNVTIYAPYMSNNSLRMFSDEIEIFDMNMLTDEIINSFDFVFVSVYAMSNPFTNKLILSERFIFTINYALSGPEFFVGDFQFTTSNNHNVSFYSYDFDGARMGIGDPKFDGTALNDTDSNILLFLDSGHYPFSSEGKEILADTILSICLNNPEYIVKIKPRFLPDDEVVTHKNSLHLYDVLEKRANGMLPANLIMLREHRDLQELINECKTVICMYTTAYIGAGVAGKGLAVLDGIPSEDVYDVREKNFINNLELMKKTGALINYKDVNNILPDGIKMSNQVLNDVLTETENVADKIYEVVKYIYNNFIVKGLFPQKCDIDYKQYKRKLVPAKNADWQEVISKRWTSFLKWRVLSRVEFVLNKPLDVSKLEISGDNLSEIIYDSQMYKKYILNAEREFICNNYNLLLDNYIDAGILLDALFALKRFEDIKNFPQKNFSAYYYFRARIAYNEGEYPEAIKWYSEYLSISLERAYIKEITDNNNCKLTALENLIELLYNLHRHDDAELNLRKLKSFFRKQYRAITDVRDIKDRKAVYTYIFICIYDVLLNKKVFNTINEYDEIVIYGAGQITQWLLNDENIRSKAKCILDKNPKKEEVNGVEIVKYETVLELKASNIIVTPVMEFEIIKTNLIKNNCEHNIISVVELLGGKNDI